MRKTLRCFCTFLFAVMIIFLMNPPVTKAYLSTKSSFDAGLYHSLLVCNDGTVWAWGQNQDAQLGDGSIATRYTPVQVYGLNNVIAVSAGYTHSLALKSDGTVWVIQ